MVFGRDIYIASGCINQQTSLGSLTFNLLWNSVVIITNEYGKLNAINLYLFFFIFPKLLLLEFGT